MRMVKHGVKAVLATILLTLGLAAPAAADDWSVVAEDHSVAEGSPVSEKVWTAARPPGGAFDKVSLHRYRAAGEPVATLLYLPGTNMNGALALTDEAHNLWLFLAARGVEVFALDYRTHAVPADASPDALAAMKDWDSAVFVDDIRAAAAKARAESGRAKLFVAGFSRGAFLAYAYANIEPETVAGLVILDGPFKAYAPKERVDRAAAVAALAASGEWASDVGGSRGWEARQQLMRAVIADPNGPASDPAFKTIGAQLAHVLQTAWGPGALANPEGGASDPAVLARLLVGYDRYYPAVQDIDGKAISSEADAPDTALDDRWGRLEIPVLLFANTGMGAEWVLTALYSAAHAGSKDVTFAVLEGYGHLDVLVGERAAADVFDPTLAWIRARAQ